jgi:putative drug exporter of the RND superfamily
MIRSTTTFAIRHRWLTIIVWVILGGALMVAGKAWTSSVTESEIGGFLPDKYDSAKAMQIAEDKFDEKADPNTVTILVARSDGAKITPQDRPKIDKTAAELGRHRFERKPAQFEEDYSQAPKLVVGEPAPDGSFQLVSMHLKGKLNDPGLQDVYRDVRDAAKSEFDAAGFRTGYTGGLASTVDDFDADEDKQKLAAMLTMVLIVLLNVLVFRSVLAAIVPLLVITVIGGAAQGAVVGMAKLTGIKLDTGTPSIITVVLLGIGIDYFLFLMFRFREQLRTHPDQSGREAAVEASGKVGTAITCAALTIVAAFATLGIASFGQFRVLGPAIAVSVLVMLVASLTLLPALLSVFGRGMFWPAKAWKKEGAGGVSARLGLRISRRPLTYAVASLAILAALGAGAVGVKMNYDQTNAPKTAAVEVAGEIARSLPAGVTDPHTVFVASKAGAKIDERGLTGLTSALAKVEGVGQVAEPTLNPDGTAARIDVFLAHKSDNQQARDLVSGPVRDTIAKNTPAGTEAHITGPAAIFADVSTAVNKDLKLVFPVAAILIALILFMLLRCVLAPLVLMIAVGLGFVATLGASTLVFQHTLDRPGVSFTLPLILFLFVVALGTDYNILISDRIREEMDKPVTAKHAVAEAVKHTAPAIATAGLVLAGSFASLAASPAQQELGFATGLGILLSATVLSIILVPALSAMLGRGMWWPKRPGRAHRKGGADSVTVTAGVTEQPLAPAYPGGARYQANPYQPSGYDQQQPYPPQSGQYPGR